MKKWEKIFLLGLLVSLVSLGTYSCTIVKKINPRVETFKTFVNVKNSFGGEGKQAQTGVFVFPVDTNEVTKITMLIKNDCPSKSCDEWDRFANISVKDPATNQGIEMGRFITPYWVGFEKLPRGLEIDVTSFRSLLKGRTELRIYTETGLAKGRIYSVDFEFSFGEPKYKYSKVIPVFQYNKASIGTIPYGRESKIDLKRELKIPENIENAYLRSVISGGGHATPFDENNRGCSEGCFRTHALLIDGVKSFTHFLGPMDCGKNPVNNQQPGNWASNRAGWCPGMEVIPRINTLPKNLFGKNFILEYKLQEGKNDGKQGDAFYSLSTYLILESKTPIT